MTDRRWFCAALALASVMAAGCAGGQGIEAPVATPPQPTSAMSSDPALDLQPVPRWLTPGDTGQRYAMTLGQSVTLTLADPEAADPVVEGAAVLLIQELNIDASSGRRWEIRAVAAGTSTIAAGGGEGWSFSLVVS